MTNSCNFSLTHRAIVCAVNADQLAQVRARLDAIDRLLRELSAELKAIREQLHAVAPSAPTPKS